MNLKGVVLGQTEEKVTNTFSDARGGVLFIDEAYSLASDPQRLDVYGAAAIDTLVGQTELPENAQTAIILAGYPEPMRDFLGTNPGLARRFPTKVMFPDYTNEECLEILQRWFTRTQSGQSLPLDSPEVGEALFAAIARRRSMPHFGNAGDIEVLGGCIVSARNARLRTVNPAERRDQSRPTIEDIGSTRDARDWPPAWTPKDTRHVPPKRAARLQPTCHVARDAV